MYILTVIFKICTTNRLFKYFRKRYSDQQLKILNTLVRTRGRIRALQSKTAFLKACISHRTLPSFVKSHIQKSRAHQSPNIERAFMQDEITKNVSLIHLLQRKCRSMRQEVRLFLSYFDLIRFCRYVANIDERKEKSNQTKNESKLNRLLR